MSGNESKIYDYFSENLISWQKNFGRHDLPWQKNISPYRVWISEMMLQQTQVKTVLPYFERFMEKYPTLKDLSKSDLDDILKIWTGLGYYRRAEYIHKTSKIIKEKHNSIFPENYEEMIQLPGIGRSTAGAIMSIAFKKKYPILDGNVKRVIKRFFAIHDDNGNDKKLWQFSENLVPKNNNDIYTQAIMDLGATLCTKKNPTCDECPVRLKCKSHKNNLINVIPIRGKKIKKKEKELYYLMIIKNKNFILMKKNPKNGIWANLWMPIEFSNRKEIREFLKNSKISKNVQYLEKFNHHLTHLKLKINICFVNIDKFSNYGEFSWKNIYDNIATSKPIFEVIQKLAEEYENENDTLLKIKERT